jgi:hypothetical protein
VIDLATARAYLAIPATALPDADLDRMLMACAVDQAFRIRPPATPEETAAADQGLLRRVQKEVASKNLPLGMVGIDTSEYGPARIPFYDALVEEHERGLRKMVLA